MHLHTTTAIGLDFIKIAIDQDYKLPCFVMNIDKVNHLGSSFADEIETF
jgi:hypothetical protein